MEKSQRAIIANAHKVAEIIVENFAEIAEAYREGKTQEVILKEYQLDQLHGNIAVVRTAISLAIKELIPEDERMDLWARKNKRSGENVKRKKLGIHRLTSKQLANTMTPEERQRRNWLGMEARGAMPWDLKIDPKTKVTEEVLCLRLLRAGGRTREKIAQILNERVHEGREVRNETSVYNFEYNRKKGRAKKQQKPY